MVTVPYSSNVISSYGDESVIIEGSYLGEPGETLTVTSIDGDVFSAVIEDSHDCWTLGGPASFTMVTFT
jgi:hypothetical protein